MPIKIPNDLPAVATLATEGIQLISENEALRQDIRPMHIALLNLMPDKITTETQLARLLGASPLQIELTLLTTSTYRPNNVQPSHLQSFYRVWSQISDQKFDGLIITGAPVELLDFEEVKYWSELVDILDWSRTHVHGTFNICWGAQAALHHFHGVPKSTLREKRFGIFKHYVTQNSVAARSPLLRGFDDTFLVPVSRYTEVRAEDLPDDGSLNVLAVSDEAGLCLLQDADNRHVYMFNHLEYDTHTLSREYERDLARGIATNVPTNYFPANDPSRPPRNRWRAYAHLLFANWINEIYQTTPYELDDIGATAD